MTWGQIRLLVQQFAPGVSLDTIDQKINARYVLLLSLMEWKGIEKSGVLETTAAINTGTIDVTQDSATVTGTGTSWTEEISGLNLLAPGTTQLYTVAFVDGQTLTLDRPYESDSSTAMGYQLVQAVYALPPDCRQLRVITSPVTGLALNSMTELEFAQSVGIESVLGPAIAFIPAPDLVDPSTGLVLGQQIRLYPIPAVERGYPILYEQMGAAFDGVNTSAGPLPFVSADAIIAGAKADLEADKETPNGARLTAFEAQFTAQLKGMIHQENQKRTPHAPRMHAAYTRHRFHRLLRSLGGARIYYDD